MTHNPSDGNGTSPELCWGRAPIITGDCCLSMVRQEFGEVRQASLGNAGSQHAEQTPVPVRRLSPLRITPPMRFLLRLSILLNPDELSEELADIYNVRSDILDRRSLCSSMLQHTHSGEVKSVLCEKVMRFRGNEPLNRLEDVRIRQPISIGLHPVRVLEGQREDDHTRVARSEYHNRRNQRF